jgi:hypothetical protein
MKNDQFIDAVQTVGIVTIAIVLSYVVVRFEGMLSRSADRLKDRIGWRIETIEAVLDSNKAAIAALSNGSTENDMKVHPSITEERMSDLQCFVALLVSLESSHRRLALTICLPGAKTTLPSPHPTTPEYS